MHYAWWMIDFTDAYRVRPTAYKLTDGYRAGGQMLRTFDVFASNDKVRWDLLDRRTNDLSLTQPLSNHTWDITTPMLQGGYRYFLINQTDRNAGGLYVLSLSGFEVYGTLCGTCRLCQKEAVDLRCMHTPFAVIHP